MVMKRILAAAFLGLSTLAAHAKVRTMQVTLGAGSTPIISQGDIFYKWVIFQNNNTHTYRMGDSNVSATRGILLLAGPGGGSVMQQPFSPPISGTLAGWYAFGTAGDVVDIIYDDGN